MEMIMRILRYSTCPSASSAPAAAMDDATAVSGTFSPVNLFGEGVSGTVAPEGDMLSITFDADGMSPGMHLSHIHGFAEAKPADATFPDATADANGDGWVDRIETQTAADVTMIPLTDDPAGLAIQSESCPSAGDDGRMTFEQTFDPAAEFGTPLALPRRVVSIHGVPEGSELPDSVQSLEGVPASVTMPVACAELDASGS